MKFIDKRTIKLDKELNLLDEFVIRFVRILEKHVDYVIVSGYVSILLGRSRATDDIDVFIKEMSKERFSMFYSELKKLGYWCLNGKRADYLYGYLADGLAIRFALDGETVPNFEVKFAKKRAELEVFDDFIVVLVEGGEIKISCLERQIAYKKYYLKSDKDLEDAHHLEKTFKESLDLNKIERYRGEIENEVS